MLSNQTQSPAIHHRRQKSSPLAFNPQTATEYFPITYAQPNQNGAPNPIHRRGNSLDQPMRLQDTTNLSSGNGTVSTNQGYQQQPLRETQMPGLARPGQFTNLDDIFAISPGGLITEKDFGDFGPIRIGERFSNPIDTSMTAPVITSGIPPQQNPSRPHTPMNQFVKSEYPVTPQSDLPRPSEPLTQSSPMRHDSIDFGHSFQSYSMKRGSSYQDMIQNKRAPGNGEALASAPSTVPMRSCATFPDVTPIPSSDLLDIAALDFDFSNCHTGYDSSNYSPTQTSPAMSSRRSSPDLPPVTLFGEIPGGIPQFTPSGGASVPSSPTKARDSSPRKKAQPLPAEMTIEETGITSEQVEAFIQGPDPETNKYKCLFEGCSLGSFGRKENIRAHVQTHLGDRKYVCTVCQNKFVRPNDLKRHAIIHQEAKEYICKCGAAFGRQDALRRHRIRKPFCVDGDPTLELMRKEEKKRGRPRKIAPTETTERRERKEHIRKQVMAKKRNGSLAPSTSSTQKSDRSCSPEEVQQSNTSVYSPGNMSLTPPASPQQKETTIFTSQLVSLDQQNKGKSPSPPPTRGSMTGAFSHDGMDFGQDSPFTIDPFGPADPSFSPTDSQVKSSASSPPELDLSSSPSAPRFMDFSDPVEGDFSNQSTQGSLDDFGPPTSTAFEDELFTNNLMEEILKEGRETASFMPEETIVDDVERYLFLDSV